MRRGFKRLAAATLLAGLLVTAGAPRLSDAARFDGTPEGTPTLISADPMKIAEARHYRNRVGLAVTPETTQVLLGIQAGAPGTVTIRIATTAYSSNLLVVSTQERRISLSLDGLGTFASQTSLVVPGAPGHDSSVNVQPFLPTVVQAEMITPAGFDRVLLEIEVFASRPMTFVEFW